MPRETRMSKLQDAVGPGPTVREAMGVVRENLSGEDRMRYNQYARKTSRPLPIDQWLEIQKTPVVEQGSDSEPGARGSKQSLGGKYGSPLGEK